MRAIKSVLVMAGQRRRQKQVSEGASLNEDQETFLLIDALRDANLPKFLVEDVPLFDSIMADLFPGVKTPKSNQEILERAIGMAIRDQGLQTWSSQLKKVKQLHSQMLVRHGIMLVGPTGGGKSTVRGILQRALVLLPVLQAEEEGASPAVHKSSKGATYPGVKRKDKYIS